MAALSPVVGLILIPLILYVIPILVVFMYALYIICFIEYEAAEYEEFDDETHNECRCGERHQTDNVAMLLTPKNHPRKSIISLNSVRNFVSRSRRPSMQPTYAEYEKTNELEPPESFINR